MLNNTRSNTKSRQQKNSNKERTYEHDIDLEFLIDLYHKQKGLCAYSNIPMQFGPIDETEYKISIERINPLHGYIKSNICLICIEFNVGDYTAVAKGEIKGSCAWSKKKFDMFKENYTKKN
jgi:hypothetical protein